MIVTLMFKRLLPHASSSKKYSLTFLASEPSKKMKSFSHVKIVATTMRTGKPNGCIQFRHLPPPDNGKLQCIKVYHYVRLRVYNGITSCGHSLKQFSELLWCWFLLSGSSSENGDNFTKQDSNYSGNVMADLLLPVHLLLRILQV